MNKIDFQEKGFNLTTYAFEFLQKTYQEPLKALAKSFGEIVILHGVVKSGNKVSAGSIIYKGEILPFIACTYSATVSVVTKVENEQYNVDDAPADGNYDNKEAYVTRYAQCGNAGTERLAFSSLKTAEHHIFDKYFQKQPRLFTGTAAELPPYHQFCDGTNGTPNLKDRFVVGAGANYSIGDKGGASKVSLSENQMPRHKHRATVVKNGKHNHDTKDNKSGILKVFNGGGTTDGVDWDQNHVEPQVTQVYALSSDGEHTHDITVANTGSGLAHENRPPYYALAYIMFVG